MNNQKVFGIVALKGGVGKTTLVANLGASLVKNFNKKVLMVDANFSTPHLGLHVGMVGPKYNLQSVLNNEYSIYEAIYQHPLGFHIIPGKVSSSKVNPLLLKEKLSPLKDIYDVILIDSSPSLNEEIVSTMVASDEILVVSSPDYPTLSSTLYASKVAKKENTSIKGIILNRVRGKRFELCPKDISSVSDIKILASIPEDVKVAAALSRMTPIIHFAPKHTISHEVNSLASTLIGEKYQKSKLSRLKKKIFSSKEGDWND